MQKILAWSLLIELVIPIAVGGFSEPITTLPMVVLWALVNGLLWHLLCTEKRRWLQGIFLIASAACLGCLCAVVLIFAKPSLYLKVTPSQFILNRRVVELGASVALEIFMYSVAYRVVVALLLLAGPWLKKRTDVPLRKPG